MSREAKSLEVALETKRRGSGKNIPQCSLTLAKYMKYPIEHFQELEKSEQFIEIFLNVFRLVIRLELQVEFGKLLFSLQIVFFITLGDNSPNNDPLFSYFKSYLNSLLKNCCNLQNKM